MRHAISCFAFLAIVLVACIAQGFEKPNIIFILADDQGFGDVEALNSECKIPTPNLNRIAAEGMYFSDAHSSSSVCTPTRYSILTGRYHWRTHLQKGVLGGYSLPLIAKDRLTVAGLMKEHGYHTACIGKWHLGLSWPLKDGGTANDKGNFANSYADGWNVDYTAPIKNGPTALGFDYFFGISASLDMPPYVYIENDTPTEIPTVEKKFIRKGPAGAEFEAVDVLPKITEKTVDYINRRAASARNGQPFFIYFPLNAPHTPIVPTGEWEGKSGINKYADFTMQVDHTVGQILKTLDEQKLTENTLIIFTTDNGCSPRGEFDVLAKAGHDPSYIYRGHKADIFEGGHRVPFLCRWPGKIKPGTKSDQLICQSDLMATCAEIVNGTVPEKAGEDSVSILPALLGEATKPIREAVVHQSIGGQFAIRKSNWKLCLCPGSGGWSAPRPGSQQSKGLPEMQLYDLDSDPGEEKNLVSEKPEKVEELKALLAGYIQRGRSTPGAEQQNDVKIIMVKPIPKPRAKKKQAPKK